VQNITHHSDFPDYRCLDADERLAQWPENPLPRGHVFENPIKTIIYKIKGATPQRDPENRKS